MDIELKELSNIYLQSLKEEDGAAGEGQNPQQSVDVSAHAKAIRYQARRDNVPLPKAFNDYVAKKSLSGSERTALRQKLGFMEEVEILDEKKGCNHTHKGEECEVHGKKECPSLEPVEESDDYKERDKILKRAKPLHKHLYKNLHKADKDGDVNESRHFSWRTELSEYTDANPKAKTEDKSREKITEKKVKNKIVINPPQGMTEAIEEMGGQILEMVEIEEGDFPKDAPSIKDAKPAKKTDVKYDPHMKVMAPTINKEEAEDKKAEAMRKKQLASREQMMKKQHLLDKQRMQAQKSLRIPSGHMEGLSVDDQMKISQDYNRKSPEEKLAANKKALGFIKKVKREKDTRTDAEKMTDATGPRPGSRYRGD